jgi:glycopeptide antibiotics resistance protein
VKREATRQWVGPVLAAAVIVLATLPYDWQPHAHWARVAWLPFVTGLVRVRDMLVNTLLYMPFGAALQWRHDGHARWPALVAGALLSVSMELLQVWSHDRFPSATDVAMNIIGCGAGATSVWWWRSRRAVTNDTAPR